MWMGIYPSSFLNVTSVSVEALIQNYQTALTDGVGTSVAAR
jgi:NADH-quinone oxidoreductase subunit M